MLYLRRIIDILAPAASRRLSGGSYAPPAPASLLLISLLLSVAIPAEAETYISTSDTVGVKVYFRQGNSTVEPSFRDNGTRLGDFIGRVSEMYGDMAIRLSSVDIVAYSSPEGSYANNKALAVRRADNISAYLRGNMPFLSDTLFNVQPQGINWAGLAALVEASDMRYRSEVLDILHNIPESAYRNGRLVDSRRKRLMDLHGGRPYNYMLEHFFPELRTAGAYIICDFERIAPVAAPDSAAAAPAEEVAEQKAEAAKPDSVARRTADAAMPLKDYDRRAIKSNALYLAAGVTNIGGEHAFHPHWSVDFPLVYSPYTISRTYRMRFLYIQPEARYWLYRPMKGHFFGVHFHAGVFNVSFDTKDRFQSEKGFHGAGISYGYAMPLSSRWSMEFTVGVGYAFTKYCAYYNVPNGIRYEKDIPYNYWGITKLGLNFVYRFGDKCGKKRKEVQP